jgi:hypothetical protein
MKLTTVFFTCFLFMTQILAKDIHLVEVTNDDDHKYFDLYIVAEEDGTAKGLKMWDRVAKDWTNFDLSSLAKEGAILRQKGNHKVIVMKSNDFEVDRGGHFIVDYLASGVSGRRESLEMKVELEGDDWKLYREGQEVKLLDFKVRRVPIIGVVGIDKVQFTFAD